MNRKGDMHTKTLKVIVISMVIMLMIQGTAAASGPFGPPQSASRAGGGLHTGIGYWLQEDKFKNNDEYINRQQQIYSELGYGIKNNWDLYARLGLSELKLFDAFSATTPATTTSKNDFEENWKFFSTVGAKGFYPFNETFGIGAFIQGTYYFSDFTDTVSGTRTGVPFSIAFAVKNLWDVSFGMGFQVTVPYGIKMYIGPYVHYSEFKVSPSADVAGVALASGETILRNKTAFGGFTGIEVPLAKGFRLNLEGQYTERLSAGAAVIYVY